MSPLSWKRSWCLIGNFVIAFIVLFGLLYIYLQQNHTLALMQVSFLLYFFCSLSLSLSLSLWGLSNKDITIFQWKSYFKCSENYISDNWTISVTKVIIRTCHCRQWDGKWFSGNRWMNQSLSYNMASFPNYQKLPEMRMECNFVVQVDSWWPFSSRSLQLFLIQVCKIMFFSYEFSGTCSISAIPKNHMCIHNPWLRYSTTNSIVVKWVFSWSVVGTTTV